jgi:hypothetical protein
MSSRRSARSSTRGSTKGRATPSDLSDLRIDYSELSANLAAAGRRLRRSRIVSTAVRWLVGGFVLAALPFLLLIRGGVLLYQWWGLGTWPSLLLSALATMSLLAAYAGVVGTWLGARKELRRLFARGAMGIGAAYVAYALVFVASANAKTVDVRAEYRSLHPLLRLASSAVILVDPASVITDASRTSEDYARMGLPTEERSLHYRQPGGYVHALDFRTTGRSGLRNLTVHVGFRALGFRVLRHGGTGDHLHVSLPVSS